LFIIFALWEKFLGDRALLPVSMFLNRTQVGT
jgi:hypothetical protein